MNAGRGGRVRWPLTDVLPSIIIGQQLGHFGISILGTFALNVVRRRLTVSSIEYPVAGREGKWNTDGTDEGDGHGRERRMGGAWSAA